MTQQQPTKHRRNTSNAILSITWPLNIQKKKKGIMNTTKALLHSGCSLPGFFNSILSAEYWEQQEPLTAVPWKHCVRSLSWTERLQFSLSAFLHFGIGSLQESLEEMSGRKIKLFNVLKSIRVHQDWICTEIEPGVCGTWQERRVLTFRFHWITRFHWLTLVHFKSDVWWLREFLKFYIFFRNIGGFFQCKHNISYVMKELHDYTL